VKVRCYQINDAWRDNMYGKDRWFGMSIAGFLDSIPSVSPKDYDYIQIVPMTHWRAYYSGNAGTQAFRHKATGWAIPDCCRQRGGCPEMWHRGRKRQLDIAEDSPVWSYIVEW